MKLLLTSQGLFNDSIANALYDLTGKDPQQTTVVFVPTATNGDTGDKTWFIDDLWNIRKRGFKSIEITDISAVEEKVWRPSMEGADVLFFEGGCCYHLMRWLEKSGLKELLPDLLANKVYVGASAGSMVAGPRLLLHLSKRVYEQERLVDEKENVEGLNLVDFYFLPHLNTEGFPGMVSESLKASVSAVDKPLYAIDDNSALKIVDREIEVISEGEWLCL